MNYERINLNEMQSVSSAEFALAINICKQIANIVSSREETVKKRMLNLEIALPQNRWAKHSISGNDIHDIYQLVSLAKYEIINRLRLYCRPFTGYFLRQELNAENLASTRVWLDNFLKITKSIPGHMIARFPPVLGEIGWNVSGNPVNHDVYVIQERLNCLYESGIIDYLLKKSYKIRILEVGSGYGGLARCLKEIFPASVIYLCDIPESLLFSALYLGITMSDSDQFIYDGTGASILQNPPDNQLFFIPNFLFGNLKDCGLGFDLVVNTLSFSEISEKQLSCYAEGISQMLGEDGVLFEQNQNNESIGLLNAKTILQRYFSHRRSIRPDSFPALTQGEADMWSNLGFDGLSPSLKSEQTIDY
ncbi:MAG: putative sugar O-methyltransferase [Gammaproteobacteria bacterium]|nr:putative sugar O-methyltransferase [Gammaproteobacteria bacterium]